MNRQTARHPHRYDPTPILDIALLYANPALHQPDACTGYGSGCTCPDCEKVNDELWRELNRPRPVRVW